MFAKNKAKDNSILESQIKTLSVLSSSVVITGKIDVEEDIRIDGCVKGNISCNGKIVVGPSGHIIGNIKSRTIILTGKIVGDINVSEIVVLKASSYYEGHITARNIEIEAGASFFGNCKMEEQEKELSKSIVRVEDNNPVVLSDVVDINL